MTLNNNQQRRRPLQSPRTLVCPVAETFHGHEIVDPFRWLEGDGTGKLTADVATWTKRQNELTRSFLDSLPGRESVTACLDAILDMGELQTPVRAGNRCFFLRRRGSENQPKLYCRELHETQADLLLDINQQDPTGMTAISGFLPDHSGRLLALTTFAGGDEISELRILDCATKEFLPDRIGGRANICSWLPDASGFVYSRLEDVNDPYSKMVALHRLGEDSVADRVIMRQHREGPLATTWGPTGFLSHDGKWLILGYATSCRSNDLWIADFEHWHRTGELCLRDVLVGQDASAYAQVWQDRLIVTTTFRAPRGRVLACSLSNPEASTGEELCAERADAVLEGVDLSKDFLIASYLRQAAHELLIIERDGTMHGSVPLPGIGTASVASTPENNHVLLGFTSFQTPLSVFSVDLCAGDKRLHPWETLSIPFNVDDFEVRRESTLSTDGTSVGFFIVKRKNLHEKGPHPTLLYGYGGFGVGLSPQFYGMLFPWLKAGGVFVVGNFRGGNEEGEAWHRAGMLENKERVFDDAAAVAYWLLGSMLTRTDRLAFYGRSNGGLLAGTMAVRYPHLFRAVISEVPLLDMLRYQHFLMARYWVPEYGSAEDPGQFRYLRNYSPYHHVREGIMYPAVLLSAGENDTRVHPLHARKMAAALQRATTTFAERPILLWVDRQSGHGIGKPRDLRLLEACDRLLFLFWQLAVTSRDSDMSFCFRPRR